MAEYTDKQDAAAIAALLRMRRKFVTVRDGMLSEAPDWIRNHSLGRQILDYTQQVMEILIEDVDRMIIEKDYK